MEDEYVSDTDGHNLEALRLVRQDVSDYRVGEFPVSVQGDIHEREQSPSFDPPR